MLEREGRFSEEDKAGAGEDQDSIRATGAVEDTVHRHAQHPVHPESRASFVL